MAKQLRYGSVEIYIDDILGVGSYGKVCKGKCGQLPCAVKLLHDTMFQHGDPGIHSFVRKFEQECQFLSSIKHPNIVQYLGTIANPESGRPVLLMELMDESLTKYLERSTGPPYYTQVDICHDIALALAYLHFNAIIHRDLSGNNVLLIGAGSRAKVTDFGMSKLVDMNPRMTPLTQCPGTSAYMPPEALITSPGYSSKLDCFSLGVLGIQIVTRKFPNPGDAYTYIKDPKYPAGCALIPIPEINRRKEDIDLISADHTLLPIMLRCIKDLDEDRPSAEELCEQLSSLKSEARYMHSKDQSNDQSSLVQRLQLEVATKEQEIQSTIETKIKEFETTLQQKTKEHQKAIQRNTEEHKRELQQKTEEHQKAIQRNTEEHKRELQQKTEEHQKAIQRNTEEHRRELQQKTEEHQRELQQKTEEHQRELKEKKQIIQGLCVLKSGTDVQHKEDESDNSDCASPYCLLDEPCCDKEKKKAVWKVKANTTAQPSPSQLKSTGNHYKISGNAEKIMDLRFDKEILKADLNDTPAFEDQGATAFPHDHMTFDDTWFDHVTSGGSASDSNFPTSLYDVVPSLIPDVLALLEKLPEGRIPGVYYRPSEGVVYIKKNAPEDTNFKFQIEYQCMANQQRKLKIGTIPVPSGWVVTDVKQVVAAFNGKYDRCVFLLGEELVKIISNSSRQFEQAKKLLLEEFQTWLTVSLADGRMFTLKKGNIVTEDVDAIVNAANGRLHHDGGIALAIDQASNGAVQHYSTQYMRQRQYREMQPGNVACTGAGGTLKCKSIIHAVRPRKGDHQCENTLNSLMRKILKEAEKREVVSIAIPAISSGIFGVDKDLVARCIIDSIMKFKFSKSTAFLRDIRVVIIDQPTYQCFAKYLKSKYKKLVVHTISESKDKNAIISTTKGAEMTENSREAVPGTEVKGKDFSVHEEFKKEEKEGMSKDVTPDDQHTEKTEAKTHSGTSDCDQLINHLQPLAQKWRKLANSLNFSPCDILYIANGGGDDTAKMERMIRTWWEQHKEKDRMRMLIKCLEKSNLGESDKLQKATDTATATVTTTSSFNRSVSDPTPSLTSPGDDDPTMTSTHGRGKPSHLQRTDINGVPSPQGGGMSSNPPPGFHLPSSAGVGRGMGSASYAHATASTTFHGLTPSHLGQGGYGASPQLTSLPEFPQQCITSTHGGGIPSYPIIADIAPSSGVSSPQGGGILSSPPHDFQNPLSSTDMGEGMGGVSYARATASGGGTFRGLSPSHFEHGISMGPPYAHATASGGGTFRGLSPSHFEHGISMGPPYAHATASGGGTFRGLSPSHFEHGISMGPPYAHATASGGGTLRGLSPSHFEHGISMGPPPSIPTEVPHHIKTSAATAHPGNKVEEPKCSICLDGFKNPVKTSCGHSFCKECINASLNASPYCPTCKAILRCLRGNQPPGGKMTTSILEMRLPGYPGHKTIKIEYYIPGGVQGPTHPNPGKPYSGTSRVAFLPCNAEGYEVLTLLRKAFSAGLIFTVGKSLTSGKDNVVVWNDIHHKSSPSGGPYGYPDPTYLRRVKEDLAAKGIVSDTV